MQITTNNFSLSVYNSNTKKHKQSVYLWVYMLVLLLYLLPSLSLGRDILLEQKRTQRHGSVVLNCHQNHSNELMRSSRFLCSVLIESRKLGRLEKDDEIIFGSNLFILVLKTAQYHMIPWHVRFGRNWVSSYVSCMSRWFWNRPWGEIWTIVFDHAIFNKAIRGTRRNAVTSKYSFATNRRWTNIA